MAAPRRDKRDLTDRHIKALEAAPAGKRSIEWDAQVGGFGIRITDQGHKSFVLVTRYPRDPSRPVIRAIGDYPTMPLATARRIAREWREDIRQGIDPRDKAEAARRETSRRQTNTFSAAFEAFAQEHLATLRTGKGVENAIRKHVLPVLGDRPLAEITRGDGNELLRAIAKSAPIHANRIASYLGTFGQWAEDDGRIEESPFVRLKRFGKEESRDRALSNPEIRTVWQACAGMGAYGLAVRFMLATGQRRSEVAGAEWTEFDIERKLWVLPRERTKANRAHEIPLSPIALSILDEARKSKAGQYVFSVHGSRPVSGWSGSKVRLGALAGAELPAWRLHDLRRTTSTNLARLRVERLVISKILNHAEGGVTKAYDRYAYLPEKRKALDAWGARLEAIVAGETVAEDSAVLDFEEAAAARAWR